MNFTDEQLNHIIDAQLNLEIIEIQKLLNKKLNTIEKELLKKRITSEVYLWYR